MTALSAFDAYRDDSARKLMIEFVTNSRRIDPRAAVAELRALNHVGLAYVYRDALAAAAKSNAVEYDPCEVRR
jgi:hypothetical protein